MADISGIPSHVPQDYKDQLQSFQSQIKILLQNHQVRFLVMDRINHRQKNSVYILWLTEFCQFHQIQIVM